MQASVRIQVTKSERVRRTVAADLAPFPPHGRLRSSEKALFERCDNAPASRSDACLVPMSELYATSRVFTLDSDCHIYRRHGRKVIPLLRPE